MFGAEQRREARADHCHIQAARLINPVDQGPGKKLFIGIGSG
jgi:hypothetical protein